MSMEWNEAFAVMRQICEIFLGNYPPLHPTTLSMQICSQQDNQVFTGYSHKPAVVSVLPREATWKNERRLSFTLQFKQPKAILSS